MNKQQDIHAQTVTILMEKNAILERELARKNKILQERETILQEREITIQECETTIQKKNITLEEKQAAINKLATDLDAANFQLEQIRRMIYGAKRERFIPTIDAHQMKMEFEPQTLEIEQLVSKEREKIRVNYTRTKQNKKHQGRLEFPSHLPVVEIIINPTEDTTGMVCIGKEETRELAYSPAKLHVNCYIRPIFISKEDETGSQKQVIAPLDRPIPKCMASTELLAMIFANKYVFHMPLYRILQQIKQMGFDLPSSTLGSWVKLGAELLVPLFEVHRLHVFRECYQMIDESPIKVQDKNLKGTCHQGYMWVRYAPLSKSALFEYYPSRSAKDPISDLNTFTGFIQTDGYSGYTYLAAREGITHLSCWAHARRYFDKALGNDYQRASHVMKLIQVLYSVEALAREANMTSIERHALRLEKSLPVINEIGQYIYNEKSKVTPKSPIGKAFEYCSNRWISLQNYLKEGILEIDSNLVENAIRPLALGRKNYLFAGSHDAAKNIGMFYSFFATCKKHDIEPQAWLIYVIKNINNTKSSEIKNLLPQFIDKKLLA
ncbi:MAG: IS66 family transposase [Bacteroidetes bacterium]|nr:MAG: IS66 family transposase [Bacteroidota bacterium]